VSQFNYIPCEYTLQEIFLHVDIAQTNHYHYVWWTNFEHCEKGNIMAKSGAKTSKPKGGSKTPKPAKPATHTGSTGLRGATKKK
jgi:hypothetical protein